MLGALADNTRWDILETIVNADNKIAYSEIQKALNISDDKKGPFNYHLKELQKAGWIRNYIETKEGTKEKSLLSENFHQIRVEPFVRRLGKVYYVQYTQRNSDMKKIIKKLNELENNVSDIIKTIEA